MYLDFIAEIQCPSLPSIVGGTITYSPDTIADFDLGTSATHECNDGFILRGNVIRVCEEGAPGSTVGIWSGTPPVCEREYLLF